MKNFKLFTFFQFCLLVFSLTSCRRSSEEFWDDTRTASRHMGRGLRSMCGSHGDSRQICCRDEIFRLDEDALGFTALSDEEGEMAWRGGVREQETVSASLFQDPDSFPGLGGIFEHVRFPYNSNLIKGDDNLRVVRGIASYLKENPNVYLFIEGHCDDRGPAAYNMSLGLRRSHAVRDHLIKQGIAGSRLFVVSYGKERPFVLERSEEAWAKNRRAEFKIYARK